MAEVSLPRLLLDLRTATSRITETFSNRMASKVFSQTPRHLVWKLRTTLDKTLVNPPALSNSHLPTQQLTFRLSITSSHA